MLNEWVWSSVWMVLTDGNWTPDERVWGNDGILLTQWNLSVERKTLCSVGVISIIWGGTMVECYGQRETEVLRKKHYVACVVGEWMNVGQWGNGTDRGHWNTGKEILCSVAFSWINGSGAMVECYWQRDTEVLGEKHVVCVAGVLMGVEQWWNVTDSRKLKYWVRNM